MLFLRMIADFFRGALIGVAEIVPGVSGGTIALIVGVYEGVIESAGHLVRGVVRSVTDSVRRRGMTRAREHFAQVQWRLVIPIIIGMLIAVVVASAIIAPLIEDYPIQSKALFAGLILASLIVPIRMVGRWGVRELVLAAVMAVALFLILGIPAAPPADPSLWLVLISAAVAVCALVLPGVSGSFLLVTIGMYAPTLAAVNDRNFAYLGVFILGAVLGLGLFVSGLQWLLEHHHRTTLAVMTGLMLGSLRALWPWQEDNELVAPGAEVPGAILFFVIGLAVVAALIAVEAALVRRRTPVAAPTPR